jgi:short-subunit dehydrogenase
MRKAKSGTIINTSSMGGKMYTPMGAWYHATKHALEGWSDCLRIEIKQFNINVVILEPGLIATEFADVLYEPMMKVSGNGPYKAFAISVANSTKEA